MNSTIVRRYSRLVSFIVVLQLSGCYYMQAVGGQMEIVRKRQPIEELVSAEDTSPELAARLQLVTEARQFSIDVLGLPDNDSYRSYADIERDYVVWNVIAAPEFSLQAKSWCYPVAGCVSYRGYFSKTDAEKLARELRDDGFDVAFGGVAAYSTLGKFDDPILSTMMQWNDAELVAVMFHELAHQVLYVKGETGFNESFATAVEEFGMERWLASREQTDDLIAWRERRELRSRFADLVAAARDDLSAIYEQPADDAEKRRQKQARLHALAEAATQLFTDSGSAAPGWLQNELNNARVVSTTLYHGRLPEFRDLLATCENDLPCFYRAARMLADST
jgi:predicted aminopeptidase